MFLFESVIALLAVAVALAGLSRKIGAPYPAFLALVGAGLAFAPGMPRVELEPELALALFVAPVLVEAGYGVSVRDLRRDWRPVAGLVLVAVALTTIVVALVARWLWPALPLAAAIALGAIVAPPDAVAASTVLRHVNPPRRLVTILEGESLLNDASALVIYRAAVIAAGAHFAFWTDGLALLASVPVSVGFGWLCALAFARLSRRFEDAPSAILVQFVFAFGVWLAAERLHLSAVLAVVTYAVVVGRIAPAKMPARLRLPSHSVWETAIFFLNALAFVLIGLQIGPIMERLDARERLNYFEIALAVLATVVAVRFAWVFLYGAGVALRARLRGYSPINPAVRPTARAGLIVSWCGMRGILSLAAALALPQGAADGQGAFPERDLIVFCAFVVVLGTLVLQGFTLGPLLRVLDLPQDEQHDREIGHARTEAMRAAHAALESQAGEAAERVRAEYASLVAIADSAPDAFAPSVSQEDRLHQRAIIAARRRLLEMRAAGEIGDDAFQIVQRQLDRLEMSVADD